MLKFSKIKECTIKINLKLKAVSQILQIVQLWWKIDFLIVRKLFQRRVLRSDDVDLLAYSHVVLVHQLDVFPFLKRTIHYKYPAHVSFIHLLLVIFPFPIRLFVRFSWCDTTRHIRGSSAFACAASFARSHLGSALEASRFDWGPSRKSTLVPRQRCQEMGMARGAPRIKIKYQQLVVVSFAVICCNYLIPMVCRHVLKCKKNGFMWVSYETRSFLKSSSLGWEHATSRRCTYPWGLPLPLDFRLWHSEIWELQRCVSYIRCLERDEQMRIRFYPRVKTASHPRSICCQCHFGILEIDRRFKVNFTWFLFSLTLSRDKCNNYVN